MTEQWRLEMEMTLENGDWRMETGEERRLC
jgi:hypothetical protein